MPNPISTLFTRATAYLSPAQSSDSLVAPPQSAAVHANNFTKAPTPSSLFPEVDPAIDGEDCDKECGSCSIKYPWTFRIDETDELYGRINGWATHILVATGRTDWVKDVTDEKGSVMEAVGKFGPEGITSGKLMLSASNIPVPPNPQHDHSASAPTTVLLLPSFTLIDNVTPASVEELIFQHINPAPTTTTPLSLPPCHSSNNNNSSNNNDNSNSNSNDNSNSNINNNNNSNSKDNDADDLAVEPQSPPTPSITPPLPSSSSSSPSPSPSPSPSIPLTLKTQACPHAYVILLCSQRSRDIRCGQSAPLLRRELERQLRPLGLYRDLYDTRPGGVGIYFISHVGGHKYSANVLVYRKEAGQGIWLARVRPEDCEGIVKFTVLQGKVVGAEKKLRGGFDRGKGVVSW